MVQRTRKKEYPINRTKLVNSPEIAELSSCSDDQIYVNIDPHQMLQIPVNTSVHRLRIAAIPQCRKRFMRYPWICFKP